MTLRQSISVLSIVLLPFASAACGRHSRGHDGDVRSMAGRRPHMHRMHQGMGDPVARLLDHQAALRLTAAQVNSLISIDGKLLTDNAPLRDRLMALRPAMRGKRASGSDSSNAARTPQRDSAAAVFQQIRENRWRAMNAAYGQLTDEQMGMVGRFEGGGQAGGVGGGIRGGPPGGFRGRGGPGVPGGPPGPRGMTKPGGGAPGGGRGDSPGAGDNSGSD